MPILFALTLLAALLDWLAVWRAWNGLMYVAKPATMLLLLGWVLSRAGFRGGLIWFALGLLFSLTGDIMLMLPREQFVAGLLAFLLAHGAYIVGLNLVLPRLGWAAGLIAVAVALACAWLYQRISAGLLVSGHAKLRLPVLIYSVVLSLMTFSALLAYWRPGWNLCSAVLVGLGAVLFFVSDAQLAWDKFVGSLRLGRLRVHVTYHLGQIAIMAGVVLHVVGSLFR
jgi:uncharacterized membrane protein YhhN